MTDGRNGPTADAVLGITTYVMRSGDGGTILPYNVIAWPRDDDDPDGIADRVRDEVAPEPADGWRLSGGDDHDDDGGAILTSYSYVRDATADDVRTFVAWFGGAAEYATINGGLLTGPEEHGYIPAGLTWSEDGMSWNVGGASRIVAVDASVWPVTDAGLDAIGDGARAILTGADGTEDGR